MRSLTPKRNRQPYRLSQENLITVMSTITMSAKADPVEQVTYLHEVI